MLLEKPSDSTGNEQKREVMLDASLQVHQNIGSWRFMAMKHKRILDSQEGKAGQSCAHFQLMEKKQTYRKRKKKGIERERRFGFNTHLYRKA